VITEFNADANFFAGHKGDKNQMPGQNFFNYVLPH
jgi:hypothetical protein